MTLDLRRIADGLWHWRTEHPDYPAAGPTGGWSARVGSTYLETDDAIVLFDPQIPLATDERDRFLDALDRDLARTGAPLAIALTNRYHARSSADLERRYRAVRDLPDAVVALAHDDPIGETSYLVAGGTALVVGDLLLGAGGLDGDADRPLRRCPPGWYGRNDRERTWYATSLPGIVEALAAHAPRVVLTAHGAPVTRRVAAAFEDA